MNKGFTKTKTGGMKEEKGKTDWTLFPWTFTEEVTRIMMYGAEKYDRFNWHKVPAEEYIKAAFRHLIAHQKGERFDRESGFTHIAHAACDLLYAGENLIVKDRDALKEMMDDIQDFEQFLSDRLLPKMTDPLEQLDSALKDKQLYLDFSTGTYKKKGEPC